MISAAAVLLVCAARVSWAQLGATRLGSGITYTPAAGLGGVPVLFGSATSGGVPSRASFGGLLASGFNSISYSPLAGTPRSLADAGSLGAVPQLKFGRGLFSFARPGFVSVPPAGRHLSGFSFPSAFGAARSLSSFPVTQSQLPSVTSFSSGSGLSSLGAGQLIPAHVPRAGLALGGFSGPSSTVAAPPRLGAAFTTSPTLGSGFGPVISAARPGVLGTFPGRGLSSVSYAPVAVAQPRVVDLASQSAGSTGVALGALAATGLTSVGYTPLPVQLAASRQGP